MPSILAQNAKKLLEYPNLHLNRTLKKKTGKIFDTIDVSVEKSF